MGQIQKRADLASHTQDSDCFEALCIHYISVELGLPLPTPSPLPPKGFESTSSADWPCRLRNSLP